MQPAEKNTASLQRTLTAPNSNPMQITIGTSAFAEIKQTWLLTPGDGTTEPTDETTPPPGGDENVPDEPTPGLPVGAVIGIVIGSVAVVGIGGFALVWFVIKKKSFADLIAVFKKK